MQAVTFGLLHFRSLRFLSPQLGAAVWCFSRGAVLNVPVLGKGRLRDVRGVRVRTGCASSSDSGSRL